MGAPRTVPPRRLGLDGHTPPRQCARNTDAIPELCSSVQATSEVDTINPNLTLRREPYTPLPLEPDPILTNLRVCNRCA